MNSLLAVFSSRSETFAFANLLKARGCSVSIVSTPRGITSSCSLSVRFARVYYAEAQGVLSQMRPRTFVGFF